MIIFTGLVAFLVLFAAQGVYRNWNKAYFDGVPESMGTVAAWKGTDNDKWWARWTIRLIGWQAFGPWSAYSWARWTFPPKVLFQAGGAGIWRYEQVNGLEVNTVHHVLSRCQYYKRWALVVEWPLSFRFHVYWRAKDVPVFGIPWTNEFSIKQLLFFYGPIHWDTTPVYWLLSFYLGGQWK